MILKSSFSASGKLVISGEHSVLYGYPAISVAIHQRIYVAIKTFYDTKKEIIVISNKFGKENFTLDNKEIVSDWCKSIYFLCKEILKENLKENLLIEVKSNIENYGYGSSGALFVAVSSALYKYKNGKKIHFNKIFKLYNKFYQYENIKPSGIDIITSYYGSIIYYSPKDKLIEKIDYDFFKKLDIYSVYTGHKTKTTDTIKIANDVKKCKKIYNKIGTITEKIKSILLDNKNINDKDEEKRYKKFFELIEKNQQCLKQLNLCDKETNDIIEKSKKNGFISKISGSGLGDSVVCFKKKNNKNDNNKKDIYRLKYNKISLGKGLIEEKLSFEDNNIIQLEKEIVEKEKKYLKKLSKNEILKKIFYTKKINIKQQTDKHFSPINLALIKYWGKLNNELNLPLTPSVSITSKNLGTTTQCFISQKDELWLNEMRIDKRSNFYKRTFDFVDLFRNYLGLNNKKIKNIKIRIETNNNFPTSSGMASSASGFCTLTYTLIDLFGLNLSIEEIATITRIGSGSSCRSVFGNKSKFVKWINDSVEECNFNKNFSNNIECIVLLLSKNEKKVSSREAMKITLEKSVEYQSWLKQTEKDFENIFKTDNFDDFGIIVENNSLSMHKAIQSARIDYFNNRTKQVIEFIKQLREKYKIPVYLSIDAGANVFLLFEKRNKKKIIDSLLDNKIVNVDEILNF